MTFPFDVLARTMVARAGTWNRLGFAWRTGAIPANHGKPVVRGDLESATRLVAVLI